ncbi:hypothetical protein BC940DRAFT_371672 [Gongronella butleri]|nr:hypothetical protein BC940DRAFT_371672 [Gongronella butleri]
MVLGFFPYQLIKTPPPTTPSSYFGDVVIQFSKQVLRPRVMLPMLLVIVLLFDLDDTLDLDDFDFEEDDENDDHDFDLDLDHDHDEASVFMYPHLTRQNPTLTQRPTAPSRRPPPPPPGPMAPFQGTHHAHHQAALRHPAFSTSQPMIPSTCGPMAAHPCPGSARSFDPSTSSPIFYGYVPVQSMPPLGPKL